MYFEVKINKNAATYGSILISILGMTIDGLLNHYALSLRATARSIENTTLYFIRLHATHHLFQY
jgi:hypothetical protein